LAKGPRFARLEVTPLHVVFEGGEFGSDGRISCSTMHWNSWISYLEQSIRPSWLFRGTVDVVIPRRPVDVRGSLPSPELVSVNAGECVGDVGAERGKRSASGEQREEEVL
jgi:hypothetical protein